MASSTARASTSPAPTTRPSANRSERTGVFARSSPPASTITRCQCSCSAWMSVRYATPKPICPYQRSVTVTPAARTRSTAGSSPSTSSRPSSGSPSGTTARIVSTSGAVHRIPADSAAEPPKRSVFSSTTTRSPRSAACAAAARPGLPSADDDQIVHPPLPRNVTAVASLSDISRHAGVSIATCSRVLNGSNHPVSEETRERVLNAAKELGYAPSALARALVTRSSRIIGVIVADIVDPYFAEIARGVEEVAVGLGYLTMVCSAEQGPEAEIGHLRQLRDYHAAGHRVRRQRPDPRPGHARARRRRRRGARARRGRRRARAARLRGARRSCSTTRRRCTTSRPTCARSATRTSCSSRARRACTRARSGSPGFNRAGGGDRVPGGFSYEDGVAAAERLLARGKLPARDRGRQRRGGDRRADAPARGGRQGARGTSRSPGSTTRGRRASSG